MRRKSERTATKKAKASPEKKVEKVKRTRTRRRKQSTSSENESEEGSPVREIETETAEEPPKADPTTPVKEVSPEESQDQVWQVKTAEGSGDIGEIQKLKICLTRPPSTPERAERSPRSKRKHSRATSSSDTPSNEGVDEKRRSRRSKRRRESKEESDKNHDSQGDEQEAETETIVEKSDSEISQSTKPAQEMVSDDVPMSTTNEESKVDEKETISHDEETVADDSKEKSSDADTTVASPKAEAQSNQIEVNTTERKFPERERSASVEKSEVLEIHPEDNKIESSESQPSKTEEADSKAEGADISKDQDSASSEREVSISEDKNKHCVSEDVESALTLTDTTKNTNENDVVESSENVEIRRARKMSIDSDKEKEADNSAKRYRSRDIERSDSTHSAHEEPVHNGQAAPIVVSRKRKWGSRPKITTQKSITISTDVLKEIIPDVKPAEFDEVIEEKKHKRIEVIEKIERPVLPKIIIDNRENVEQNKKDFEDKEKENIKRESNLSMNRRISIVKDNDSIITRPPSPPRHKQSNILYITNLVRPFTLPQLKNLLQRTGRIAENGFWIDRIKSKCFVQYENEDQAVETRHALHGVTWPVSNLKTLQVDFSTQEAFDKAKLNEDTDNAQASTIPGTVEDWLREQDIKRERGEVDKPWERKATMREWDVGKNEKDKEKERVSMRRDERLPEKRRHRSQERSPEPAKKFKKKEEEAPAKLLDDLFRKTKTTPCIYWLPLSAETIAIKEEQRRQHMAEHERRMQELRRTQHRRH